MKKIARAWTRWRRRQLAARRLSQIRRSALERAVAAAEAPTTAVYVDQSEVDPQSLPTLSSHFGGQPYMAAGERWPTWGDKQIPYDFVCQINLNDCPVRPEVPFSFFTVWLCWEALPDCEPEQSCFVRTYVDPDPAAPIVPRPKAVTDEDYQVRPCTMRMEETTTFPTHYTCELGVLRAASVYSDPQSRYESCLPDKRAHRRDFSRIGGHPAYIHYMPAEFELIENSLIFLGQIRHEVSAANCIGDAAPIFMDALRADPMRVQTDVTQTH